MTAQFVSLLDQLRRRSLRMASLVEDIVEEAGDAALCCDAQLAKRVIRRDNEVDAEEVGVEGEVIRLMALYQPVGADLRLLCTTLKVNSDLERVADCAVNIAERARYLKADALPGGMGEVTEMVPAVRRVLRLAIQAYGSEDVDAASRVFTDEERVDAIYGHVIKDVIARAAASPDSMAAYLDLLSVAKNLERIADHATNIAEDVVFLSTGKIVRHKPPASK